MQHDPADGMHAELTANLAWARRVAFAIAREDSVADDLAQEAALAALEQQQLGRQPASIRSWFAAVLRRLAVDRARSESARAHRERESAREEAGDRGERARRIVEAVLALPEPYRATVLLRYLDELPLAEVAQRTGVSERTVRTRVGEALERLRTRLADELDQDPRAWALVLALPLKRIAGGGLLTMKVKWIAAAVAVALAVGYWRLHPTEPVSTPPPEVSTAVPPVEPSVEPAARTELPKERTELAATPPPAPTAPAIAAAQGRWFVVVDARTHAPLAGSEAAPTSRTVQLPKVSADPRGLLNIPDPPNGSPQLWTVRADGYSDTMLIDARGARTGEPPVEIGLRRSASLQVRVVDSAGKPVAGFIEITASLRDMLALEAGQPEFELAYNGGPDQHRGETSGLTGETSHGRASWAHRCDDRGVCSFPGLPSGVPLQAAIVIQHGSIARRVQPFTLEPGEQRDVEWPVAAAATLRARLVEQDGSPVANQSVWLVSPDRLGFEFPEDATLAFFESKTRPAASARTDAEGMVAFDSIRGGDWYVGPAFEPTHGFDPAAIAAVGTRVHFDETRPASETRITIERGLFVGGVVLGESGAKVPVMTFTLFAEGVRGMLEGSSDSGGEFLLGPLPRVGARLVPRTGQGTSLPVQGVQAGDRNVEVRVPVLRSVRLRVFDPATEKDVPIASVAICAGESYRAIEVAGGTLEARLDDLLPRASLFVRTLDGRLALLPSFDSTGDAPLRLPAARGCELELRNDAALPRSFEIYLGDVRMLVASAEARSSTKEILPAGALRVVADGSEQRIELAAGASGTLAWK